MTDSTPSTGRRISLRKRPTAAATPVEPVAPAGPGKGRPTPKRSEAQRRRGGPVAPPPATRREAAKRLREQSAQERRSGVRSDRMLARDAGPVRAVVRDTVDVRRSFAVLLLPVAALLIAAQVSQSVTALSLATRLWVLVLLVVVIDTGATAVIIRRKVHEQFPDEASARSHVGYGLLRTTVIRRFRVPRPVVTPPPLLRRRSR